jgi:cytidine deaminase
LETLKKYESIDLLRKQDRQLLKKAIETREQAYAPYSLFKVGAAILLENDMIITGNNQENAVYPSGLCAERVAIFSARANYPNEKIMAVAISCRNTKEETHTPFTSCGSCRQVMLEYELEQHDPIRVLFYGETGEVWEVPSTRTLLPLYFDKSALR